MFVSETLKGKTRAEKENKFMNQMNINQNTSCGEYKLYNTSFPNNCFHWNLKIRLLFPELPISTYYYSPHEVVFSKPDSVYNRYYWANSIQDS